MTPAEASRQLFLNNIQHVAVSDMQGKTSAVMLVPYPPGIPIMMGGEKFDKKSQPILDYLLAREKFEQNFPGYYSDIHGIEAKIDETGLRRFYTMALTV